MKYLIMEDFSGQPVPFVFPRRVDHADMREQLPYGKILSAGFLEYDGNNFLCHGSYTPLGVSTRQEDVEIIKEALRLRS